LTDSISGLRRRCRKYPAVLSASLSWYSPLGGKQRERTRVHSGKSTGLSLDSALLGQVGPHYFRDDRHAFAARRVIEERDRPGGLNVAVINETFARTILSERGSYRPALRNDGCESQRRLRNRRHCRGRQISGHARPCICHILSAVTPNPARESPFRGWVGAIELHVAGRPENVESAVRKALADADPNLPVLNMMSFDEQVAHTLIKND